MSTSFLALYRGESVSGAKLLALTAEPDIVSDFAGRLLGEPDELESDTALHELEHGRRRALQLIHDEASE